MKLQLKPHAHLPPFIVLLAEKKKNKEIRTLPPFNGLHVEVKVDKRTVIGQIQARKVDFILL